MWQSMFVEQIPLAEKIIRTILVYALLMLLFRLTGKRGLAALNNFDFIVIFLLSNVVQNAVIGNDASLLGGAVGAVTLVAVNAGINRLTVISKTADRIFEGSGSKVIEQGVVDYPALRSLGIRRSELDHAVRLQNGDDIRQVADGQLEPTGQLVLTLKKEEQSATKADVTDLTNRLRRIEELLTTCRFSNFMSSSNGLTCGDVARLMPCHLDFVSNACHFSAGRSDGEARRRRYEPFCRQSGMLNDTKVRLGHGF